MYLEVLQELLLLDDGQLENPTLAVLRQLDMSDIHATGHRQFVVVFQIPARKLRRVVLLNRAHQRTAHVEDADIRLGRQVAEGHEVVVAAGLRRVDAEVGIGEDIDFLYVLLEEFGTFLLPWDEKENTSLGLLTL